MPGPCPHERFTKGPAGLACVACGAPPSAGPAPALAQTHDVGALESTLGVPPAVLAGMAIAFILALVIGSSFPFVAGVIGMLGLIAHEFGHALVGWALGYPSIPSLNLQFGGGITHHLPQSGLLLASYAVLLAWFLWSRRRNPRCLVVVGGLAALWAGAAWSESASRALMALGGEWGTLLLGVVFLFRALTGVAVAHAGERWLYALVGWRQVLHEQAFAWALLTDDEARDRYYEIVCCENDWIKAASELHVSLGFIAGTSLALGVAAPLAAWALWRWREAVGSLLRRVLAADR